MRQHMPAETHACTPNGAARAPGPGRGCGGGALAIAACLASDGISKVYGLDVMRPNIEVAKRNAVLNGVHERTEFFEADCFEPVERGPREALAAAAPFDFIVANPPADAESGDGFGWRRRIAKECDLPEPPPPPKAVVVAAPPGCLGEQVAALFPVDVETTHHPLSLIHI